MDLAVFFFRVFMFCVLFDERGFWGGERGRGGGDCLYCFFLFFGRRLGAPIVVWLMSETGSFCGEGVISEWMDGDMLLYEYSHSLSFFLSFFQD